MGRRRRFQRAHLRSLPTTTQHCAAMLEPDLRFAPKKVDVKADLAAATAALEKAKSSGKKKDEGVAYSKLASLYIQVKKYEKALAAAEPALEAFTAAGEKDLEKIEFQKVTNLKAQVESMKGPKFEMLVAAKKGIDAGDDFAIFEAASMLYSTRRAMK